MSHETVSSYQSLCIALLSSTVFPGLIRMRAEDTHPLLPQRIYDETVSSIISNTTTHATIVLNTQYFLYSGDHYLSRAVHHDDDTSKTAKSQGIITSLSQ